MKLAFLRRTLLLTRLDAVAKSLPHSTQVPESVFLIRKCSKGMWIYRIRKVPRWTRIPGGGRKNQFL